MNFRILSKSAVALALVVASAPAFAAIEKNQTTHDGKVVSITGTKLVMTGKDGKEHSHTLTPDVKVTLDGKVSKTDALKAGTRIRVTTQGADKSVANRIEAINRNPQFASTRHDGKVVSITGNQLVMTGKDGQEHSHTLTSDAKLTLDGKVCKAADLKAGTRIRVTTLSADNNSTNRIEALDKNPEFAGNTQDGKFVSITGNQLVMTNMQSKEEHTCTLAADAKISCDGRVCKAAELKPGMRIRVTADDADPSATVKVEALDKNQEFASL